MAGTFKNFRRKVWFTLNMVVVFWVLIGVYCMQVPPYEFWPAAFVAFSLPGALVLNFLFLLYWVVRRSWLGVLSLMVLVLGWNYYTRLVAFNILPDEVPKEAKTLHVLSFNTHMFNLYSANEAQQSDASTEITDWVATHPADVYCLQEFYSNRNSKSYNTVNRIGTRYKKNKFFSVAQSNLKSGEVGVVIFSKYPIVDKGTIVFNNKLSVNRAIWANLDVEGDTVRVYAVHLQSMSIKAEDIENTYSALGNQGEMEKEGRNLARRLRKGFIERGHQVEVLLSHVNDSPYPVIICGDFNDIPFSYTYNKLVEELKNAFVEAGTGIGATYNGPVPFLRIDNQFYSEGLQAYDFETHYEMGLSDHFPVSGKYIIEQKQPE